ncbi:hypothetical protein [Nakamurella lactea]|uniref:hypothetical protein n=1 Tax=Nakamurella lactea TaxID=459515 RepID=UPI000424236A|nr:hypothetical protein [Nakamurella lactea]
MAGDLDAYTSWSPSPNFSSRTRSDDAAIVHTVESDLRDSLAVSLAGPDWFGSTKAGTSPHAIVGPVSRVGTVLRKFKSWAVGSPGNNITYNIEQTGRAAFTRAQWLTTEGLAQISNVALVIADWAKAKGATKPPTRGTRDELRRYANGENVGLRYYGHVDVTDTLGGTTHTDPGDQYPYDVLQAQINLHFGIGPTPTPVQEDDMPLNAADKAWIQTAITNTIRKEAGPAVWRTKLKGGFLNAGAGAALADVFTQVRKLRGQGK